MLDIIAQFLPQLTYAVTDVSVDANVHEKGFYRSLPSDIFLSKARLKLLLQFRWLKIGVISSSQRTYEQVYSTYINFFYHVVPSQYYCNVVAGYKPVSILMMVLNVYRKQIALSGYLKTGLRVKATIFPLLISENLLHLNSWGLGLDGWSTH